MAETSHRLQAAYLAAFDRLRALPLHGLLSACVEAAGEFGASAPRDTRLAEVLLQAAKAGSIEAAAALAVIAGREPSPRANGEAIDAITALFLRNAAARDELVHEALLAMADEAALELGLVACIDPSTGDTCWRRP